MSNIGILSGLPSAYKGQDLYERDIQELEISGISRFYNLFLLIWQIRSLDLQGNFVLQDADSRSLYIGWLATSGSKEYKAVRELRVFWQELYQPAVIPSTKWAGGVSRLIMATAGYRRDLKIFSDCDAEASHRAALVWFFFEGGYQGVHDDCMYLDWWQRRFFINDKNIECTRFARLLHSARKDLQDAFDLKTSVGCEGFRNWIYYRSALETPINYLFSSDRRVWGNVNHEATCSGFGVNLYGYAYGELGIGEDVRMAAKAFHAAGIPFAVINIDPGSDVRNGDQSIAEWVVDELIYNCNIFCLTALEHARVYLEKGSSIFSGRYNIGYWPWELRLWPKSWTHLFSIVDELWVSSSYTLDAVSRACNNPVSLMPMAVEVLNMEEKTSSRLAFNLDVDKYYFVFSFDGGSSFRRKNPTAVIEAFSKAFDDKDGSVGLVIKCMRGHKDAKVWAQIECLASRDTRIKIINEVLSKDDVLRLYSSCDCFVSLHRAEGFGRGIAEAFLLGLDVIASEYGGNIDFCKALEARLVQCDDVPTSSFDYVEGDENYWGEPLLDSAIESLRIAKSSFNGSEEHRKAKIEKAIDIFSPKNVGYAYKKRLTEVLRVGGV